MSILTSKMQTQRDYTRASRVASWFPCNEGSGSDIRDRVTGVTLTPSASPTYAVPNAPSFTLGGSADVAGLGDVILPTQGMFLAVYAASALPVTDVFSLGRGDGAPRVAVRNSQAELLTSLANSVSAALSASATSGQIVTAAAAWDLNNLYGYDGINAAAALRNTTALPSTVKTGLPVAVSAGIATPINTVPVYGIALFNFASGGLPTDVLTGINWMRAQWLSGHKWIYPDWN